MPAKKSTGKARGSARRKPGSRRGADEKELLAALTALGLTLNESRAYLALLGGGETTAAEAASRAEIPRPKVYEALANLESRGFARSLGDKVRRYAAVDPAVALPGWVEHRDEERTALGDRDRANAELLVG